MTETNDAHGEDGGGPLSEDDLADWGTHGAPQDFASSVVAQHFGDESTPAPDSPSLSRGAFWAAMAAVAAACIALWLGTADGVTRDRLVAKQVETIELRRAVAVAQPGAKLRWSIQSDGAATIHQDAGSVFYRVEPGERFEVITPTGTATVTGTCFQVETTQPRATSMKTGFKAGALGAALAAATIVTVYEGGVVLANDSGRVDVAAGERGTARAGSAPIRFGPDGDGRSDGALAMAEAASSDTLATGATLPAGVDPVAHIRLQARDLERMRSEKDAQAKKIVQLEAQVEELGGTPNSPEAKARRAKKCASQSRGGDCPFLDPDQETLVEMAKCATVKIDAPGFLDNREPPGDVRGLAQQLGIEDPTERKQLAAASKAHYDAYNEELRAMFLELGGDPEIAEDASADTLVSSIADQLDPELAGNIQRQVSQERAGLLEPPAAGGEVPTSIEERLFRLQANLGNAYESHVAEALGPERARELRGRHDGWPGSTSVHSSDCRE